MPHDNRGQLLEVGDHVLLFAEVTELSTTPDYCNVTIRSLLGRRPDGAKETICAINTGVLLRAPDVGDTVPIEVDTNEPAPLKVEGV